MIGDDVGMSVTWSSGDSVGDGVGDNEGDAEGAPVLVGGKPGKGELVPPRGVGDVVGATPGLASDVGDAETGALVVGDSVDGSAVGAVVGKDVVGAERLGAPVPTTDSTQSAAES